MGFQAIPKFGPVKIDGGQTSALFEFFVPEGVDRTFLRFIALFRDDEPLGGDEPTFQVRAGTGQMSSVSSGSGEVPIRDSAGNDVGSVRCERLPEDAFLLTISNPGENVGPWKVRIRNNDPEALRFLGFSSQHQEQTLQPWLVLGDPSVQVVSRLSSTVSHDIPVRNWGTAALTLRDPPGTPLGGDGSPVILVSRPARVAPHRVGKLTLSISHVQTRTNLEHHLRSDDTIDTHGRIFVEVDPPPHVAPRPDTPTPFDEDFCRRGCGCPGYKPPTNRPTGPCERGMCGHQVGDHRPV